LPKLFHQYTHVAQAVIAAQRIFLAINRAAAYAAPLFFAPAMLLFEYLEVSHGSCHQEKASSPATTKQTNTIQPLPSLLVFIRVRYFRGSFRRVAADNLPGSRCDVGRE